MSCKSGFVLKKVCYKVSLCENCQQLVVRHSLSCSQIIAMRRMVSWGCPLLVFYLKCCSKVTHPLQHRHFPIHSRLQHLICNILQKISSMTNRKSNKSFPMSQDERGRLPLNLQKGTQICKLTALH